MMFVRGRLCVNLAIIGWPQIYAVPHLVPDKMKEELATTDSLGQITLRGASIHKRRYSSMSQAQRHSHIITACCIKA